MKSAVNLQYTEQPPIRTIDFSALEDVARHEKMVELGERMLVLHERLLAEAKIDQKRKSIQHQVEARDRQIDRTLEVRSYPLTATERGESKVGSRSG